MNVSLLQFLPKALLEALEAHVCLKDRLPEGVFERLGVGTDERLCALSYNLSVVMVQDAETVRCAPFARWRPFIEATGWAGQLQGARLSHEAGLAHILMIDRERRRGFLLPRARGLRILWVIAAWRRAQAEQIGRNITSVEHRAR